MQARDLKRLIDEASGGDERKEVAVSFHALEVVSGFRKDIKDVVPYSGYGRARILVILGKDIE